MLQRSGLLLLVHQQQQVRASIYQTEMQICSPSEERAPVICMFLFSRKKQQMKKKNHSLVLFQLPQINPKLTNVVSIYF